MSKPKKYDLRKGEEYRIMGEKVTGVNTIVEHTVNTMDGKSDAWRKAAQELLEALAVENKYIVSDMLIVFLESAGYGLEDYSPLGGVFRRAAKLGIIKKIDQPKASKQSLWVSLVKDGGSDV